MAHLAVLAFDEGEPNPAGRDVGTVADGRHPFPKVLWGIDNLSLARFGVVTFDGDAFFQLIDGLLGDLSVHLGQIGARMLEFWIQ